MTPVDEDEDEDGRAKNEQAQRSWCPVQVLRAVSDSLNSARQRRQRMPSGSCNAFTVIGPRLPSAGILADHST